MVRHGQVVATLDGPEIRARAAQAQAARARRPGAVDKARHGSREEDIQAARSNYQRAVAAATIAETDVARLDRLQGEGVSRRRGATRPKRASGPPGMARKRPGRNTSSRWRACAGGPRGGDR